MNSLAILLFMRARTGSFLQAGIAVGTYTLANAAAAPVQGRLLDRLPHRRVLLVCALAESSLLIALVLAADAGASSAPLIALACVAGAVMPPVSASVRALWPLLARGSGALESAYALDATTQEVIWTLGPVSVGACTAILSASAAIVLCATVCLVGTVLFAAMPPLRHAGRGRAHRRSAGGAIASGGLRALFTAVALLGVMIGALNVGLPALAVHLKAPSAAGVLLALMSVGSMAGGVLYGTRGWRASLAARHQALLVAAAVLAAPLLLAGSLAQAIPLTVLAGASCAPVLSCQYSLVQALAPPWAAAEAFNWHTAALVAGIAAGTTAGGALVQGLGAQAAFGLACGAVGLGAVLAPVWHGRIGSAPAGDSVERFCAGGSARAAAQERAGRGCARPSRLRPPARRLMLKRPSSATSTQVTAPRPSPARAPANAITQPTIGPPIGVDP